MGIYFFCEDILFSLKREAVHLWITQVIKQEGRCIDTINYIFCSDAYLHTINKEHLGHDTWTDVITFDYAEKGKALFGDIYISIPRVEENAKELGVKFGHELARVLIHGVLHLLGYNDTTVSKKKQMRLREDKYLAMKEAAFFMEKLSYNA